MDELMREAFRGTAYHVNLDTLNWATIRVDLPLPAELAVLVGQRPWAFITAWNPQARRQSAKDNKAAQQALLSALLDSPEASVYPAIGVGDSGWSEPSLFVIGADTAAIDALARTHRQLAYVHGQAGGAALLRELG
ncbi:MAG: DUF3293 domain-containing protein [Rhodanobacter sp.]